MVDLLRYNYDEAGLPVAKPPQVSWFWRAFNVIGGLLSLPLYWILMMRCHLPVTVDLVTTIALAELNRFFNEGRRMQLFDLIDEEEKAKVLDYASEKRDMEISGKDTSGIATVGEIDPSPYECAPTHDIDLEQLPVSPRLDCMAAVVGWREDPTLFTRALESYKLAHCCKFLLVGIDGDEAEDLEMVKVFDKVYPHGSRTIHVPQPLGEVAEQVRAKLIRLRKDSGQPVDVAEIDMMTLHHCVQLARTILWQHDVDLAGDEVRQLCIRQKHMHKKAIMFTGFIFSLIIANAKGIEFLWSSDSDTIVFPDSLHGTISSIAVDTRIGGASSGLIVHNAHETTVSNLASMVYWGELYLTRSLPAATSTSDCQSGPSSVFRLCALPQILVPWYFQTLMGKRMIINEDRHLTTNLLARGWLVVFASDVLAATDTPTTLGRWLKQQVRWARATHIESLLQPKVYLMSHPLLFYGMAKREFGPVIGAIAVFYYFTHARPLVEVSVWDLALRLLISSSYNVLRNPHRLHRSALVYLIPSVLFYHIPLPAVHVWSLLTPLADGWGTTMRASAEVQKKDSMRKAWWEAGFFVVWMALVAGTAGRWVVTQFRFGGPLEWGPVFMLMAGAGTWSWMHTVNKMTE